MKKWAGNLLHADENDEVAGLIGGRVALTLVHKAVAAGAAGRNVHFAARRLPLGRRCGRGTKGAGKLDLAFTTGRGFRGSDPERNREVEVGVASFPGL